MGGGGRGGGWPLLAIVGSLVTPDIPLQGVGAVVSGICLEGVISVNDVLLLGPMGDGEFLPTTIKGIHRMRMPVKEVRGGQTASFALEKVLHKPCVWCVYIYGEGVCARVAAVEIAS